MRAALLELLAPSVCPACDLPRREGDPLLCVACRADLREQRWQGRVRTALAYRGSAARLIQRFKFEQRRDGLPVLVHALEARGAGLRVDGIVAVPRHPARVREQGADPVFDLARALARRTGLRLWRDALERSRPVPPQTGLRLGARRRNVRDSFQAASGELRGKRALLLDDVTTSGATLYEAARALRGSGRAREVRCLALAGTPAP